MIYTLTPANLPVRVRFDHAAGDAETLYRAAEKARFLEEARAEQAIARTVKRLDPDLSITRRLFSRRTTA
jgi:hypothetical protein